MTVVALVSDLMLASRIEAAATTAQAAFLRIDAIDELPPPSEVSLVLVDWSERGRDWGARLQRWRASTPTSSQPRVVLFGFHTDLEGHAAAKREGTGPMLARSKLLSDLPRLIGAASTPSP
jgi:hypothetical protein